MLIDRKYEITNSRNNDFVRNMISSKRPNRLSTKTCFHNLARSNRLITTRNTCENDCIESIKNTNLIKLPVSTLRTALVLVSLYVLCRRRRRTQAMSVRNDLKCTRVRAKFASIYDRGKNGRVRSARFLRPPPPPSSVATAAASAAVQRLRLCVLGLASGVTRARSPLAFSRTRVRVHDGVFRVYLFPLDVNQHTRISLAA